MKTKSDTLYMLNTYKKKSHTSSVMARQSLVQQAPAIISSSSVEKTLPVGLWGLSYATSYQQIYKIYRKRNQFAIS